MKRIILPIILIILSCLAYASLFDANQVSTEINPSVTSGIIQAGDFNGDGWPDIAVENQTKVTFFINQQNGSFAKCGQQNITSLSYFDVADLDGDGYDDFASTRDTGADGTSYVDWWSNNHDCTFTGHTLTAMRSTSISIADIDLDGDNDIAFGNELTPFATYVYFNNAGTFVPISVPVGSAFGVNLNFILLGDANSDGLRDVIIGGPTDFTYNPYNGVGFGAAKVIGTSGSATRQMQLKDMDGDGTPDILAAVSATLRQCIYSISGDSWTCSTIDIVSGNGRGAQAFDFNEDDYNDIIYTDTGGIKAAFNQQNGSFNPITVLSDTSPGRVVLSDFDLDGILDFAVSPGTSKILYWFKSNIQVNQTCSYPTLFCDNFNYGTSMSATKGWIVYNSDGTTDSAFHPLSSQLSLQLNDSKAPSITTGQFETYYTVSESNTVLQSYDSPVFSFQFTLNQKEGCSEYQAFDLSGVTALDLTFCANLSIYNSGSTVCDNCLLNNTAQFIKVNAYFGPRPAFPFNSTQTDHIDIYRDGVLKGTIGSYLGSVENLQRHKIIKAIDAKFTVDNYYIMVGTDPVIANVGNYYKNFFNPAESTASGNAELGKPCTGNAQCASSKCEFGQCVLKLGSEACTSDSQCISQKCISGMCKKPSLWQGIQESKDEQFGDDSMTNNFISLFFMIAIPLGIVLFSGGASIAILVSLGVFFVEGLFFALAGWLSPFIALGMVIVGLIIVFIIIAVKSRE